MDGGDHAGASSVSTAVPAAASPGSAAEQRLRGGRAEADDDVRLDDAELGVQPRPARGDLVAVRLVVEAPLAARAST